MTKLTASPKAVLFLGVLGAAYILGSTILSSPGQSLVGIGLTLIGLPVYYYKKKQSR